MNRVKKTISVDEGYECNHSNPIGPSSTMLKCNDMYTLALSTIDVFYNVISNPENLKYLCPNIPILCERLIENDACPWITLMIYAYPHAITLRLLEELVTNFTAGRKIVSGFAIRGAKGKAHLSNQDYERMMTAGNEACRVCMALAGHELKQNHISNQNKPIIWRYLMLNIANSDIMRCGIAINTLIIELQMNEVRKVKYDEVNTVIDIWNKSLIGFEELYYNLQKISKKLKKATKEMLRSRHKFKSLLFEIAKTDDEKLLDIPLEYLLKEYKNLNKLYNIRTKKTLIKESTDILSKNIISQYEISFQSMRHLSLLLSLFISNYFYLNIETKSSYFIDITSTVIPHNIQITYADIANVQSHSVTNQSENCNNNNSCTTESSNAIKSTVLDELQELAGSTTNNGSTNAVDGNVHSENNLNDHYYGCTTTLTLINKIVNEIPWNKLYLLNQIECKVTSPMTFKILTTCLSKVSDTCQSINIKWTKESLQYLSNCSRWHPVKERFVEKLLKIDDDSFFDNKNDDDELVDQAEDLNLLPSCPQIVRELDINVRISSALCYWGMKGNQKIIQECFYWNGDEGSTQLPVWKKILINGSVASRIIIDIDAYYAEHDPFRQISNIALRCDDDNDDENDSDVSSDEDDDDSHNKKYSKNYQLKKSLNLLNDDENSLLILRKALRHIEEQEDIMYANVLKCISTVCTGTRVCSRYLHFQVEGHCKYILQFALEGPSECVEHRVIHPLQVLTSMLEQHLDSAEVCKALSEIPVENCKYIVDGCVGHHGSLHVIDMALWSAGIELFTIALSGSLPPYLHPSEVPSHSHTISKLLLHHSTESYCVIFLKAYRHYMKCIIDFSVQNMYLSSIDKYLLFGANGRSNYSRLVRFLAAAASVDQNLVRATMEDSYHNIKSIRRAWDDTARLIDQHYWLAPFLLALEGDIQLLCSITSKTQAYKPAYEIKADLTTLDKSIERSRFDTRISICALLAVLSIPDKSMCDILAQNYSTIVPAMFESLKAKNVVLCSHVFHIATAIVCNAKEGDVTRIVPNTAQASYFRIMLAKEGNSLDVATELIASLHDDYWELSSFHPCGSAFKSDKIEQSFKNDIPERASSDSEDNVDNHNLPPISLHSQPASDTRNTPRLPLLSLPKLDNSTYSNKLSIEETNPKIQDNDSVINSTRTNTSSVSNAASHQRKNSKTSSRMSSSPRFQDKSNEISTSKSSEDESEVENESSEKEENSSPSEKGTSASNSNNNSDKEDNNSESGDDDDDDDSNISICNLEASQEWEKMHLLTKSRIAKNALLYSLELISELCDNRTELQDRIYTNSPTLFINLCNFLSSSHLPSNNKGKIHVGIICAISIVIKALGKRNDKICKLSISSSLILKCLVNSLAMAYKLNDMILGMYVVRAIEQLIQRNLDAWNYMKEIAGISGMLQLCHMGDKAIRILACTELTQQLTSSTTYESYKIASSIVENNGLFTILLMLQNEDYDVQSNSLILLKTLMIYEKNFRGIFFTNNFISDILILLFSPDTSVVRSVCEILLVLGTHNQELLRNVIENMESTVRVGYRNSDARYTFLKERSKDNKGFNIFGRLIDIASCRVSVESISNSAIYQADTNDSTGSKSAYATFKSSQVNTSTMKDTYLDRDNLNYISYALYNDVKVNDPRFIKEIVSLANLAGSVIACLTDYDEAKWPDGSAPLRNTMEISGILPTIYSPETVDKKKKTYGKKLK